MRVETPKLLALLAIPLIALLQPYRPMVILGHSMEPTLADRSVVLLDTAYRHGRNLCPGDVVAADVDGMTLVKRVYATGGMRMAGVLGRDQVEGRAMMASHPTRPFYQVPDGYVFLVGDNTRDSYDSRDFGPVPMDAVIGKVVG
jgi:signal peptidase I